MWYKHKHVEIIKTPVSILCLFFLSSSAFLTFLVRSEEMAEVVVPLRVLIIS